MTEYNEEKNRELVEKAPAEESPAPEDSADTSSAAAEEVVEEGRDAAAAEGAGGEAAQESSATEPVGDAISELAANADVEEETQESVDPKMAQYDETFVQLEPGHIVDGKVIQINSDEVMVDVGHKSEGRIPLRELGLKAGQKPEDVVSVGDEIEVFVLKVEDAEGTIVLSKRRADNRATWEKLEQAHENGEIIEATVSERVKGGLLVDVGVRGFVPASHVARNYVENLDSFVGEKLRLTIIELDRKRNNVVLSRKQVLEDEYEKAKQDIFEQLEEGSVVEGVVRRITDFGAFVDIGGGVEGLLHVSEMAWSRVRHPSDVLSEGDQVKVMVLNVDRDNERISLSLKETLPDPWENISEKYLVGDVVTGEVTRVVDFGAFVKLEDGIEGLVHISQLADRHVVNPEEVVKPGDEVTVKVVSLDEEARRIGLSIREAQPKKPAKPQQSTRRESGGSDQSGGKDTVTLGDVFEDLSTFFDDDDDDEKNDEDEK